MNVAEYFPDSNIQVQSTSPTQGPGAPGSATPTLETVISGPPLFNLTTSPASRLEFSMIRSIAEIGFIEVSAHKWVQVSEIVNIERKSECYCVRLRSGEDLKIEVDQTTGALDRILSRKPELKPAEFSSDPKDYS